MACNERPQPTKLHDSRFGIYFWTSILFRNGEAVVICYTGGGSDSGNAYNEAKRTCLELYPPSNTLDLRLDPRERDGSLVVVHSPNLLERALAANVRIILPPTQSCHAALGF